MPGSAAPREQRIQQTSGNIWQCTNVRTNTFCEQRENAGVQAIAAAQILEQCCDAGVVIGDAPRFTVGADRDVELRLGDVDADLQRCSLHRLRA